jgi:hypothetical protein
MPIATIVLQSRGRGIGDDKRTMRGRREEDEIGAKVPSVQRSGGPSRARPALPQGGSWF